MPEAEYVAPNMHPTGAGKQKQVSPLANVSPLDFSILCSSTSIDSTVGRQYAVIL